MEIGILHTHHLIIVLYILLFTSKTVLLLANQKGLLATLNGKTKIPRMVLEILMLVTGVFLATRAPESLELYNIIKYVTIALTIPLGIIAFRKSKPLFAVLGLICLFYAYGVAKTRSPLIQGEESRVRAKLAEFQPKSSSEEVALERGREIYNIACVRCHGSDGNHSYRKSKILASSLMAEGNKATIIKQGQKMMPAFEYLNEEEINDVVKYINTFKK